jgi:hypothetical protein
MKKKETVSSCCCFLFRKVSSKFSYGLWWSFQAGCAGRAPSPAERTMKRMNSRKGCNILQNCSLHLTFGLSCNAPNQVSTHLMYHFIVLLFDYLFIWQLCCCFRLRQLVLCHRSSFVLKSMNSSFHQPTILLLLLPAPPSVPACPPRCPPACFPASCPALWGKSHFPFHC